MSVWKHDLYNGPGKTLGSRLSTGSPTIQDPPPKYNASGAAQALKQAIGLASARSTSNLSIKGASSGGANVIQVENLASGTTAADVEMIFKQCGPILESYIHGPANGRFVAVRLKYKKSSDAQKAVDEFHDKPADGSNLKVTIVGTTSTSLGGRLGGTSVNDAVDILMGDDEERPASKMRSDELLHDPRAHVLTAPPGTRPNEWQRGRGSGRGRRGGRNNGGGRGRGGRMDLD